MSGCPVASRRGLFGVAAGLAASVAARRAAAETPPLPKADMPAPDRTLPFHGPHQNGIATPMQAHTYFAAFDVVSTRREDVAALMRAWTDAAARLAVGQPAGAAVQVATIPGGAAGGGRTQGSAPGSDSGDVLGLPASRLTVTFGFGPSLFERDGVDRFGLAGRRPEAFVELPRFAGDQLVPERTGGDLSVQACADDPQVVMHALRQFMRLAEGVAVVRWVQAGFLPGYPPDQTPRNLMGFKDGTVNVSITDPEALAQHVWVGDEGGPWMKDGSYVVARPIRIALEHWDRTDLAFQEETVGRQKVSGAPIGGKDEFEPADFDAADEDGNPLIAENAHMRLAAPASNDGAQILRRGYAYDNGVSMIAERWPPWRHMMEMDAGLLFVCYQRDPRAGFIKIFDRMSKLDMLNQFVTHIGGGLFACPGGAAEGRYIGQALFEDA